MQEQEEQAIGRKIAENRPYKVWRRDTSNGLTFYTIQLRQKMQNGNEFKYYQPVRFRKGVSVENGTTIKIVKAFENDRPNPKDEYSFIREYMIMEYTIEDENSNPYEDYKKQKEEANDPYSVFAKETATDIDESQLPF